MGRFEDLVAWQRAVDLAERVYALTADGAFERDWALRGQMRRAAASVVSNIAEGYDRGGRKEFARFLEIALGSCGELRAQVHIAGRVGFLTPAAVEELFRGCQEVSGLTSRLRTAVRRQKD